MTAPSRHRVNRARESERLVAGHLAAHGWPHAHAVGPFQSGSDVLGTPGLTWEIKSVDEADFRWRASLAQANGHGGLGAVVARGRGCGPANVGDWPIIITLGQYLALLHQAGHGLSYVVPAKREGGE